MKGFWLNFCLILMVSIAIPVSHVEAFTDGNHFNKETLLKGLPNLGESVPAENRKDTFKKNYIAQSFLPIVIIAESFFRSLSYVHYLPLYNLQKEKEYFLLI